MRTTFTYRGPAMDTVTRVKICILLEKIENNPEYARKISVSNSYATQTVQSFHSIDEKDNQLSIIHQ